MESTMAWGTSLSSTVRWCSDRLSLRCIAWGRYMRKGCSLASACITVKERCSSGYAPTNLENGVVYLHSQKGMRYVIPWTGVSHFIHPLWTACVVVFMLWVNDVCQLTCSICTYFAAPIVWTWREFQHLNNWPVLSEKHYIVPNLCFRLNYSKCNLHKNLPCTFLYLFNPLYLVFFNSRCVLNRRNRLTSCRLWTWFGRGGSVPWS